MTVYSYFDAHCDTLSRCLRQGWSVWENPGHLDLKRLSAYEPRGQVFALFADSAKVPQEERFRTISAQAALLHEAKRKDPAGMENCFLSVEGAELLGCDEGRLEEVKEWGVRWVNLTWNHPNALCGSCRSGEGLTQRGRDFVRRCGQLGLGIDLSHLSDQGAWDVLRLEAAPVLASHSNSRALCGHPRNLTDALFRAIVGSGGFVGLNLCVHFLGEHPTAETAADHLEHFLALGGEDHLGLGSDFDGTDVPEDLSGVQDLPKLWAVLERRGFSPKLIHKLSWENLNHFLHLFT